MNTVKITPVVPLVPSLDAGSSRVGANRNISYPDLRVFNDSERRSSESTRSGPASSNKLEDLLAQLKVENQIKRGAENMLQVLDEQKGQSNKDQLQKDLLARQQLVETQLDAVNAKIALLKDQLHDLGVSSKSFFFFVVVQLAKFSTESSLDVDNDEFGPSEIRSSTILATIEQDNELDLGMLSRHLEGSHPANFS
jgi:hypothetical protein